MYEITTTWINPYTTFITYLCADDSAAVLIGKSVPNAEAISRGPPVHFVSPMALPGPTWAIRRGSSTTDNGLSEGTFWRMGERLNRGLATKLDEKLGDSVQRGGKVPSGERAFFLALDPSLVMSLSPFWEAPSRDLSTEVAANMLPITLWVTAGLDTKKRYLTSLHYGFTPEFLKGTNKWIVFFSLRYKCGWNCSYFKQQTYSNFRQEYWVPII